MPTERYAAIGDYALIGDCHAAALVSRSGSIDWCCLPRFDQGSCFGRLLDHRQGGFYAIGPAGDHDPPFRRYLDDTLVLETTFRASGGEARLLDCFVVRPHDPAASPRRLLRIVEGIRGEVPFALRLAPRFDYGESLPWIRHDGVRVYSAIAGNDGLLVAGDADLGPAGAHDLEARFTVRPGERIRIALSYVPPEELGGRRRAELNGEDLDRELDGTLEWWRGWASRLRFSGPNAASALRSAMVLKALTYQPTGAIAAAVTTSLPEVAGGVRNWDYRYSWIRDSAWTVRSLAELGYEDEADAFRRFVERSAAGNVDQLQILYGVDGRRRIGNIELDALDGYRGARPVRVGNGAARQLQLDAFGQLLELSWRWHERGFSPDDDYWKFIVELVDAAAVRYEEPDHGIWEWPGEPRHFVLSKVMCWTALDRGLRLAEECMRRAPVRRWRRTRDAIRADVERHGYDRKRRTFVQAYGAPDLDAAALRLPTVDFIAYDDERMIGTVDAIREELSVDGLLRRYTVDDGLPGREGAFLACSFWLVECLARQGRLEEARDAFARAAATSSELGLFSEEYDPGDREMLGNYPQALTHLSHIEALVALQEAARTSGIDAAAPPDV